MSRAFTGGHETYSNETTPQTEEDVVDLLSLFIRDRFKSGDEVAEEVRGDEDKHIVFFAGDGENESPATFGNPGGELVSYGSFSYRARDHGVQTIWENQFEIRDVDDGVFVRVSSWYGTTVDSWVKKVERKTLYL